MEWLDKLKTFFFPGNKDAELDKDIETLSTRLDMLADRINYGEPITLSNIAEFDCKPCYIRLSSGGIYRAKYFILDRNRRVKISNLPYLSCYPYGYLTPVGFYIVILLRARGTAFELITMSETTFKQSCVSKNITIGSAFGEKKVFKKSMTTSKKGRVTQKGRTVKKS